MQFSSSCNFRPQILSQKYFVVPIRLWAPNATHIGKLLLRSTAKGMTEPTCGSISLMSFCERQIIPSQPTALHTFLRRLRSPREIHMQKLGPKRSRKFREMRRCRSSTLSNWSICLANFAFHTAESAPRAAAYCLCESRRVGPGGGQSGRNNAAAAIAAPIMTLRHATRFFSPRREESVRTRDLLTIYS